MTVRRKRLVALVPLVAAPVAVYLISASVSRAGTTALGVTLGLSVAELVLWPNGILGPREGSDAT